MPKKLKMKKPKVNKDKKNKKQKNVNKNKQSIKINITSSGSGAGGSGGGGPPIPIQQFAQAQKTGENVEIKNLIKQLDEKQQSAINNFSGLVNNSLIPLILQNNTDMQGINERIFESKPKVVERNTRDRNGDSLLHRINNSDIIDQSQRINNGIDGDELVEDESVVYNSPFKPQPSLSSQEPTIWEDEDIASDKPIETQPLQITNPVKKGRGRPKKSKENK